MVEVRGSRGRAVLALVAIFAALVTPAILGDRAGTPEAADMRQYHEPLIARMTAEWPRVDVVHYEYAGGPGYHFLMAGVRRTIADRPAFSRWVNAAIGCGLVVAAWWTAAAYVGPWRGVALTLPLLGSVYVLSGSIWLMTDNLAMLCAACAVGAAVRMRADAWRMAVWSVLVAAAVSVRQNYVWTAAPIACAAVADGRRRSIRLIAPLAIPAAAAAVLVMAWGGLLPPDAASRHSVDVLTIGGAIPLALALVGLFGAFFVPVLRPSAGADWWRDRLLWGAATIGAAVTILLPTGYSTAAGRWGGPLWRVAGHLPTVANRNVVFPPLAAIGGAVLALAWRRAVQARRARAALVVFVGLIGWAAAQSLNRQAFQRYCEPLVLLDLAWLSAIGATAEANASTWPWIAGPGLLGAGQVAASVLNIYVLSK